MRMKNALIVLLTLLFVGAFLVLTGADHKYAELYWPQIIGEASGTRVVYTWQIDPTTAATDHWVLGDTTTAGDYSPPGALEITRMCIHWDPDSGDSIRVLILDGGGTGAGAIVCDSDTLWGTAWEMNDITTVSSTAKTITATEGMGVQFIHIRGTPGIVNLTIEGKKRNSDNAE